MAERSSRVASLDLVRGLAALLVAIPHYFILNSTQWPVAEVISILSVEVFFVLSGYVLASQIVFCSRDGRFANLAVFLVRRWMRTVPPYLTALVVLSLITGQLGTADFLRYALYVQNLFAQNNSQDYFAAAWSLSVEEWFYVTFPLLALCATKFCRRSDFAFFVLLALLFIGGITVVRVLFGDIDTWDESVRRVVIFRLDSIAYGFLLCLLVDRFAPGLASMASLRTVGIAAVILGAAAVNGFLITRGASIDTENIAKQLFPFAAAAFGASAIVAVLTLERFLTQSRYLARICLFMGRVSYSVYLFHIIVVLLLRPKIETLPIAVQIGIYIGVLVAFSSVFYVYFERPILAARPGFILGPTAGLRLGDYIRSFDSRLGVARRQIAAVGNLTRIEVFWKIVGVGLPIVAVTASAFLVVHSFSFDEPATLFYGGMICLAASILFLCWSIGIYRFGPGRVLAQSLLFVAVLLPLADLLFSAQHQREANAASTKAPKPVYSFREANGDPAAFEAWWKYYVGQWTSGAQRSVEGADPRGILPLVLNPNSRGKFFESVIRINNLGFRGPDIDPRKVDRFRVVALGESQTFGPTLRSDDRPWPELLQDKINDRLACGRQIEVINAGTPAYDLKDNLERVRRDIVPLQPDVVVSYHPFNSLNLLDKGIRVARAAEPPKPISRPSPLLAAVEHRFAMVHFTEALKRDAKGVVPTRAAALDSDLAHYYADFIRIGREHNFAPVLANPSLAATSKSPAEVIDFYGRVFPNTWHILAASDVHDQLVRDVANKFAVPFVNTTPGLNGEWDADLFLDLTHFTRRGNDVMAERVFDGLRPLLVDDPTLHCVENTVSEMKRAGADAR
jgi:peptidoglycan/LPS O-acetylase OafA/YrhL/lysophospholipase L1-like esterase